MAVAKSKSKTTKSPAQETTLVEGNGNQRFTLKVISPDGNSLTDATVGYSIVIETATGSSREYSYAAGKSVQLRVIISDRPGGEPPGRGEAQELPGPFFKIVATGGGNRPSSAQTSGRRKTVVNSKFISNNGSARTAKRAAPKKKSR